MKITSEEQARELREALSKWESTVGFASIVLTANELLTARCFALKSKDWDNAIESRQKKLPHDKCASYIAWYDANTPVDNDLNGLPWEVVREINGKVVCVCRCYSALVADIACCELQRRFDKFKHTVREVRHD